MSDGEVRTDDSVSCCCKQDHKQKKGDFFFLSREKTWKTPRAPNSEYLDFPKFLRDNVRSQLGAN